MTAVARFVLLPELEEAGLFVLNGCIHINGTRVASNELAVFNESERNMKISSIENSKFLVLGGPKITDRLVRHGPFVANSNREMQDTVVRYQKGQFGEIP